MDANVRHFKRDSRAAREANSLPRQATWARQGSAVLGYSSQGEVSEDSGGRKAADRSQVGGIAARVPAPMIASLDRPALR